MTGIGVGDPVRFKIRRSYARTQKNEPVFDEYSGQVLKLNNGNVVINGVNIPGVYNRPVSEVKKDDTLFKFHMEDNTRNQETIIAPRYRMNAGKCL